ncbi:MAG: polyprenyl synthetase family protein [Spirochaetaceae bacterium]|nr:polyprenyl synthetase family protein [Spirochaetaceae bacterium]
MSSTFTSRLEKIENVLNEAVPEYTDYRWSYALFQDTTVHSVSKPLQALLIPCRDLLSRGGKRWRPLLMTLVCESLGGKDSALVLAPLIELSHNASLIHDDIEDGSDQRRGKPALHIEYGLDQALNSGSFLYMLSSACIQAWDAAPEQKLALFYRWSKAMHELHLGQAYDISWHRDFSSHPSLEEYMTMCRLKTGALAKLAVSVGGIAAGRFSLQSWEQGAEKLGVGFQILDDIQNLRTGNPGKKRGDDIIEGKKSLPIVLYLNRNADALSFVSQCFSAARCAGSSAPEIEILIQTLQADQIFEEAQDYARSLIHESQELFAHEEVVSPEAHKLLRDLINWIGGDRCCSLGKATYKS